MHPAASRRLRLQRAEESGDLAAVREMDQVARQHCGIPWQRETAAAVRRTLDACLEKSFDEASDEFITARQAAYDDPDDSAGALPESPGRRMASGICPERGRDVGPHNLNRHLGAQHPDSEHAPPRPPDDPAGALPR